MSSPLLIAAYENNYDLKHEIEASMQVLKGIVSPVYFAEQTNAYGHALWTTALNIDLGNYRAKIKSLNTLVNEVSHNEMRDYIGDQPNNSNIVGSPELWQTHVKLWNCVKLHELINDRFSDLSLTFEEMVKFSNHKKARSKRNIFGLIGLGASLFNYANYRSLKSQVLRSIDKQKEIVSTLSSTVEVVNANNAKAQLNSKLIGKLTTIAQGINHRMSVLQSKTNANTIEIERAKLATQYNIYVASITTAMDSLYDILYTLEDTITQAMIGHLSIRMVTPTDLHEILMTIDKRIHDGFELPFDLTDIIVYYRSIKVHLMTEEVDNDQLILVLQIPIKDYTNVLKIYKAVPIPIWHEKLKAYGSLKLESEYIGISEDNNYYSLITPDMLEEIQIYHSIPTNLILKSRLGYPSCISKAYFGDMEHSVDCSTDVIFANSKVKYLSKNQYLILTNSRTNLHFKCPKVKSPRLEKEEVAIVINRPTTIKIRRGCVVSTRDFIIHTERLTDIGNTVDWKRHTFYSPALDLSPWKVVENSDINWMSTIDDSKFEEIKSDLTQMENVNDNEKIQQIRDKLKYIRQMSTKPHLDTFHYILITFGTVLIILGVCIAIYCLMFRLNLCNLRQLPARKQPINLVKRTPLSEFELQCKKEIRESKRNKKSKDNKETTSFEV